MLPIRQHLNKLANLNRTQIAVLIEVCELAEHGRQGACSASNDYLSDRLNATTRTVSRSLSELERVGLLAIAGSTTRRKILPTAAARSCYSGTPAENFAAVVALGNKLSVERLAKTSIDIQGQTIDNRGHCLETSVVVSLDNGGSVYKETTKDDQKNEQKTLRSRVCVLEAQIEAANAALAQRTTEILALTLELASSKEKLTKGRELYRENQATIAAQAQELAALHGKPATLKLAAPRKPAASLDPADYHLPSWATDAFGVAYAEWLAYRQGRRDKLQPLSVQKQLDQLGQFDEGFALLLIQKAIANGYAGLIFDDTPAKYEVYKSNQTTAFNPLSNGNTSQHQRDHQQRHGLIDADRLAKSLEFHRAMGL